MGRRSNGEGAIRYNEERARWEARVTVGTDARGRPIRKMRTARTKGEVLKLMRALADSADAGITESQRRDLTVATMLDRWIREVLPGTVAEPTEQQYADVVRLYIKPRIGSKRVRTLSPHDVTLMLRDMERRTGQRPHGYSQTARRLARSILRRALRWAEVEGYVGRNVAALANPVRVDRSDGRTMTPAEAGVFLRHISGDRLEALYVVALSLGLRVSELLALGWDDVHLDGSAPSLTVRRGLKRIRGRGLVVSDLKTKTSRRTIDLPAVTVKRLRAHRARMANERDEFPGEWPSAPCGVDLVFRTVTGTALDPSNVWGYLSKATREAGAEWEDDPDGPGKQRIVEGTGLGHWHPHELRHSAASLLLAEGVPIKVVSEILGHSSITVTADVYSHVMAPARAEAAAAMNRALGVA